MIRRLSARHSSRLARYCRSSQGPLCCDYGLNADIELRPKRANGERPCLVFVRTVRQVLGTRKPGRLYGIPIF
jgi:hypothetical protein